MFILGGPVKGGVYNADPSRWSNGDLFRPRAPLRRGTGRTTGPAYAEILRRHLGDPTGKIDQVIPGFTALETQNNNGYFTPLGFIA